MALLQGGKPPLADEALGRTAAPLLGPRSAGDLLRQQREALGLDLAECRRGAEDQARLSRGARGRAGPTSFPGPVYAIGFHARLCRSSRARQRRGAAALQAGIDGARAQSRISLFRCRSASAACPAAECCWSALILAICGYGAWYYLSTGERSRPERVAEVPAALLPPKPEPAVAARRPRRWRRRRRSPAAPVSDGSTAPRRFDPAPAPAAAGSAASAQAAALRRHRRKAAPAPRTAPRADRHPRDRRQLGPDTRREPSPCFLRAF